jgi:hypothetical protein
MIICSVNLTNYRLVKLLWETDLAMKIKVIRNLFHTSTSSNYSVHIFFIRHD